MAAGRSLAVLLGLLLVNLGCNTGAYPVDVFPEMHYASSYRELEPPRVSAPERSVPVSGAAPALTFAEAAGLANPLPPTARNAAAGAELYRVNCAVCHGADGRGQTVMTEYYVRVGAVPPTSFASDRVRARSDGELAWIIRHGLGNMPAFEKLLRDEEVWAVVGAVRRLGAGG